MRKRVRTKPGTIVYGVHPTIELIKAKKRQISKLYTTKKEPKILKSIKKILPARVKIEYVEKNVLTKIAGTADHQGVVIVTTPFATRKKFFDPKREKFLLMVDGIEDTRNLGAILRSAYCTGVHGVIITKKSSAPINASTVKASAGLLEHLEIYLSTNAKDAANKMRNAGYKIYLATLAGKNATKVSFKKPFCIVIGSESRGISREILGLGEEVTLAQKKATISYNASVAAGILLFISAIQTKIIS